MKRNQRLGLERPVLSSHVPNPALAAQWPAYRPYQVGDVPVHSILRFSTSPDARQARVTTVTTRYKSVDNAYCG